MKMVALGVDQIGFIAGDYGQVHAELTFAQANAIAVALRGKARSSALTMSTDVDEIVRMAHTVQPDIVHISTDTDDVDVAAMHHLRRRIPSQVKLMKAIHVAGPESIDIALTYADAADIVLLDTKISGMPGVGATGVTHDWNISRQIVKQVGDRAQVILAGGLTAENVSVAITTTQPWGVDSNTGTNLTGDPVVKDWDKVAAFVAQASSE